MLKKNIKKLVMDIGVLALFLNGLILGLEYYPIDVENDYSELNIYLLFFVIHFRI